MKNLDLFGGESESVEHPTMRDIARYRKASDQEKKDGTICRFCIYRTVNDGYAKNYYKCSWIGVSSSEATDIRLSGTCPKFTKKKEE